MVVNIFLSVLEISISVGLMVIVLILLSPLLYKRYAVKWNYFIWIFLALRLLIPFRGITGQSVLETLLQGNIQTASESGRNNRGVPTDETTAPRRIIVEIPTQMTTPIMAQSGDNNIDFTMLDVVVFVWIIGGLIFISVHFVSYFLCKRQIMKKGEMIEDVSVLKQVLRLKRELHIRCTVRVVDQTLEDDGYVSEENYHKWKQEGDLIYHVALKEFENNVCSILYSYPSDAEEGFGRELPVIVDTFAVSAEANDVDDEER